MKLLVALAPSLRRTTLAAERMEAVVEDANTVLRGDLCRELRITRIVPWDEAPDRASADEVLLRLLQSVPRGDADVVVGLTSVRFGGSPVQGQWEHHQRGAASYEAGYVGLIVDDASLADVSPLLAHEIAHLFGAVHVSDRGHLMCERVVGETIDPSNGDFMKLHCDRRFGFSTYPLGAGELQIARGLYAEARERGRIAERDGSLMLARIDIEQGCPRSAVELLEPQVTRPRADPEAAVILAIAYRRLRRYADALRLYETILSRSPDHHVVHYNRGIAQSHKGDVGGAIVSYRRALQLAPGFQPAMANLADVLLEHGRSEEAITLLERALELDPGDGIARATLGFARLTTGDPVGARLLTEQVLAVDPDSPTAHNTLGLILLAEQEPEEAMTEFARAAELDPSYCDPLLNLAQGHLDAGDLELADDFARRALTLRPRWALARTVRGRVMLAQESWERAVREFEAALDDDPDFATAHSLLGYAHLMRGDLVEAAAFSRAALELDPDLVDARLNLGFALMAVGNLAAAKAAYTRALEIDPQNGIAHNNLAVICFRLGSTADAWAHVEQARALGVDPNPGFLKALERATEGDGRR